MRTMSDYISRQEAIAVAEMELSAKYNRREMAVGFCGVKRIIENVPAADVRENVKGKWINQSSGVSINLICPKCGFVVHESGYKFCPSCSSCNIGENDG